MARGRLHLILAIVLLIVAGIMIFFTKGKGGNVITSSVPSPMRKAASRQPSMSEEGHKETDRTPRERTWRHAKELAQEEAAETVVSPVFLGYLQSDPSDTKLRIGLRQESGERVDPSELVVNVDLLDKEGRVIPGENEVSTKWETGDKTFEESALPVLRVDAQTAIAGVSVSLSYKGRRIEQRKYSLEGH